MKMNVNRNVGQQNRLSQKWRNDYGSNLQEEFEQELYVY